MEYNAILKDIETNTMNNYNFTKHTDKQFNEGIYIASQIQYLALDLNINESINTIIIDSLLRYFEMESKNVYIINPLCFDGYKIYDIIEKLKIEIDDDYKGELCEHLINIGILKGNINKYLDPEFYIKNMASTNIKIINNFHLSINYKKISIISKFNLFFSSFAKWFLIQLKKNNYIIEENNNWFLNYQNGEWKNKVINCINITQLPESLKTEILDKINNIVNKQFSRQNGYFISLPWDETQIIDSLLCNILSYIYTIIAPFIQEDIYGINYSGKIIDLDNLWNILFKNDTTISPFPVENIKNALKYAYPLSLLIYNTDKIDLLINDIYMHTILFDNEYCKKIYISNFNIYINPEYNNFYFLNEQNTFCVDIIRYNLANFILDGHTIDFFKFYNPINYCKILYDYINLFVQPKTSRNNFITNDAVFVLDIEIIFNNILSAYNVYNLSNIIDLHNELIQKLNDYINICIIMNDIIDLWQYISVCALYPIVPTLTNYLSLMDDGTILESSINFTLCTQYLDGLKKIIKQTINYDTFYPEYLSFMNIFPILLNDVNNTIIKRKKIKKIIRIVFKMKYDESFNIICNLIKYRTNYTNFYFTKNENIDKMYIII